MSVYFSVIIPSYNRSELIRPTIQSVLAQTFTDFELIVVDDGSTDDTRQVVEALQAQDSRIRYYWKENGERGAARNYGVQRATGKFVTFLDSDDFFYPHFLQTAYDKTLRHPDQVFFAFRYDFVSPDGRQLRLSELPSPDTRRRLMMGNYLGCIGQVVKREVLLEVPFREDRRLNIGEDHELWLRVHARYPLVYDATLCCSALEHPQRSVATVDKAHLLLTARLLFDYLIQDPVALAVYGKYLGQMRASVDTYIALTLALSKQHRWATLKYLIRAFVSYPPIVAKRRFWGAVKHWL